jgi:oligoribonuclease NrnB/cAMP/cGMP phosphodiesterase (DHH superfamily)
MNSSVYCYGNRLYERLRFPETLRFYEKLESLLGQPSIWNDENRRFSPMKKMRFIKNGFLLNEKCFFQKKDGFLEWRIDFIKLKPAFVWKNCGSVFYEKCVSWKTAFRENEKLHFYEKLPFSLLWKAALLTSMKSCPSHFYEKL